MQPEKPRFHPTQSHPVLVTGGTGFIGSHVVEQLLEEGHRVRCLVRRSRNSFSWLRNLPVEIFKGDGMEESDRLAMMNNVHTVIHIAGVTKAQREEEYHRGNVDLTRALLGTAVSSGVRRFVLISSLTAVGPSTDGSLLDESAPCLPITSYGSSKLEAEQVCHAYEESIEITILRPPAVYGPRDKDTLEMFRWVSFGLRPTIGTHKKTLSLIHVKDLAHAITRASFHPHAAGKTYFVSDPVPYRFDDLIGAIARLTNKRTIPLLLPGPIVYGAALVAGIISPLLGRRTVLTTEKARDILQPSWVCSSDALARDCDVRSEIPVDDGLRRTYEWYRAERWLR